jgi:hypothetical protein
MFGMVRGIRILLLLLLLLLVAGLARSTTMRRKL